MSSNKSSPRRAISKKRSSVLSKEDVTASFPCGPDPQVHIDAISQYLDAGYDDVYVTQVGPDQSGFARFYEREVLPHFRRTENSNDRTAVKARQRIFLRRSRTSKEVKHVHRYWNRLGHPAHPDSHRCPPVSDTVDAEVSSCVHPNSFADS